MTTLVDERQRLVAEAEDEAKGMGAWPYDPGVARIRKLLRRLAAGATPQGDGDTFDTLRDANVHRQALWDVGNLITLAYRGNELAGEVGEACNAVKKIERERLGIRGSRATKEQLAEELADVVICADLIAMHEGIDLLNVAVPAKFNATSEKVELPTRLSVSPAAAEGWQERAWMVRGAELVRLFEDEFEARALAAKFGGAVIPLYSFAAAPPSPAAQKQK